VQRGQHKVTRLRRLYRDLCRLAVSDFAHQHHIRVLPENRTERTGKGKVDLDVDLRLVDTRNLVLDGILDRNDVRAFRSHGRKR